MTVSDEVGGAKGERHHGRAEAWFGAAVLGVLGSYAIGTTLSAWKAVPVVGPIAHGPLVPGIVVAGEVALYLIPLSLLARSRGLRWCVSTGVAFAITRAATCLLLAHLRSYEFVWPPFSWPFSLVEGWQARAFRFFWVNYLAVPLAQTAWIGVLVAGATWRDARLDGSTKLRAFRLTAPLLVATVCGLAMWLGWGQEVGRYDDRGRLERYAAGDLRYVRGAVESFRERHGACPCVLDDLLRPCDDPPEVGLDQRGLMVPLAPADYRGPDPHPEAFRDSLGGEGELWSYYTRPPAVGEVRSSAAGYTLAWGIPYSDL